MAEQIISIKNLQVSYGSKEVLRGIDLNVDKGQIIGYIGPNGAGKTTTVKILLGLITDYTGSVKLFGKELSEDRITYKNKIGYVPELADLYDVLTAREYLTFIGELYGVPNDLADQKAFKLMQLLGIDAMYDSRINSYSKGMKQKVLLISSLLHNPEILFLDEPLSGLDANSMIIIKELLGLLASEGKTIFYSSHIMDVVEKVSNRIILLHGGKIVADGTFEDLQNSSKEGSLEEIFNQLTGFTQHRSIAEDILSVVQGVQ